MAWALALVVVIGVGLPMAAWRLTQHMRPPRQVMGGPGPRFDRIDRWLYDRYGFGVADRWRVRDAVLSGQELHEQPFRQAAQSLAAEMLTGKVGGLYRWAGWIRICSGLMVITTAVVVAVTHHSYAIIAIALVGLPQLVLGELYQKAVRERVEQGHRLNA